MLSENSPDKEILDYAIDQQGITIRGLTGISFTNWLINKVNGLPAMKGATQELVGFAKNPPLGKVPEMEKIRLVKKLLSLGVKL